MTKSSFKKATCSVKLQKFRKYHEKYLYYSEASLNLCWKEPWSLFVFQILFVQFLVLFCPFVRLEVRMKLLLSPRCEKKSPERTQSQAVSTEEEEGVLSGHPKLCVCVLSGENSTLSCDIQALRECVQFRRWSICFLFMPQNTKERLQTSPPQTLHSSDHLRLIWHLFSIVLV